MFDHATGIARRAEAWYARKRPSKKRWGRALRVSALLIAAVAVVLPVLSEIFTAGDRPAIAPGWTAVALAAAGALIALDHYFGFSNGWMRFMAAELRITRLRHEFEYAWNTERAGVSDPPTEAQVAALLALARAFVLAVDDAVAEETDGWVAEFRGSLERAEQSLGPLARPESGLEAR